ncbi:MAG: M20/M25/M40 family metallo-hydrolase [Gammaproteobacteria bacterium]|nr:M20/M25/M40 family metallo-hydrolase [Gammaproteobacteria bacterium]
MRRWVGLGWLGVYMTVGMSMSGAAWAQDVDYTAQAVTQLSEYLKIDTINPPGNESRGVAFLAGILEEAGIVYETAESAPGRGNIWARLEGGREPGLVLLHHIDVVPANRAYWEFDPLSGAVEDGYVYGRGAIDTKGLGIVQLQAFLALHAGGGRLNRDVVFVATADEEAGGFFGAGWLAENRPEIFENIGFLINEGGSGQRVAERNVFMVEVTQKVPLWLKLTAHGRPGHGSAPQVHTAVTRLLAALNRIAQTRFPPRVVDPVRTMMQGIAPFQTGEMAKQLAVIDTAVDDAEFLLALQLENPRLHALLRNTCSVTRLTGSAKINVVPAEAGAELDCRLLPDQDPQAFVRDLEVLIADPDIDVEHIMGFTPAVSSTKTALYRLLERFLRDRYPGTVVVPSVSTGFTDSHFFRDLGIECYGFSPFLFEAQEARGVHGNNERISVENLRRGTATMIELLERFVLR